MKGYLLLVMLVFSFGANTAVAHERDGWCKRHPRACEERRETHKNKHRLEGWCARHPNACREYGRPPRQVAPPPVYREPPRESRGEWCQRHPGKCEDRRHHRH